MKTLKYTIAITFIALVVYSNTAKAEMQKVYTSEHSQSQIIQAVETMVQKPTNKSESLIVVQSSTKCKYAPFVYGPIDYAVQVEAKDNKFRMTIMNATNDMGLSYWGMNPKFMKKCTPLIEADLDAFAKDINKWQDF